MSAIPAESAGSTTTVFEVFRQERKGQPFQHAGSVVAPDRGFADAWAREQFGRRGESEALWLVPREAIHTVTDWADEFDLKYRRVDGYSIKANLREARERAGTSGEDWASLLALADDELIVGWRDSEWTGIAPTLEEDVAFSSIAQNEIGHARALYELAAADLGTNADALAFDRDPADYRCAPLVQLHLADWAHTIARRWLYEHADAVRIEALLGSDEREIAELAGKINREEIYHRLHAELWAERLRDEPRFREAADELWPYALGVVPVELRPELARRTGLRVDSTRSPVERGEHVPAFEELWNEMTEVRRSIPGASW